MTMILIAGIPSEPPLRLAIESARAAGLDHVVFNQRRAADTDIEVVVGRGHVGGRLHLDDENIDLDEVTGVYWRMMDAEDLPEHGTASDPSSRARSLAVHEALSAWIETAPCRVANRIDAMASNASKPYQAIHIEAVGFATPATAITTVANRVHDAQRAWGPLVYKSVSSVRSIVARLGPNDDLDDIAALPTQFQQTVVGTDVRVHVVGDDIHATRITSEAVDYRYAGRDGLDTVLEPTVLPEHVADRCRALATHLGLPLCGIDLRHTPDDDWVCFEVNPSPGYSYYQHHTGQPISDSLVQWLAGPTGTRREGDVDGPGTRQLGAA